MPEKSKQLLLEIMNNKLREQKRKKDRMIKEKAMKKTHEFSFYEKDIAKLEEKKKHAKNYIPETMKNIKPYKASPSPKHLNISLKDITKVFENERNEWNDRHTQNLLNQSYMPQNLMKNQNKMERRRAEKLNNLREKIEANWTFHPSSNKEVPNFKLLHKKMQDKMEKNKTIQQSLNIKRKNPSESKMNNEYNITFTPNKKTRYAIISNFRFDINCQNQNTESKKDQSLNKLSGNNSLRKKKNFELIKHRVKSCNHYMNKSRDRIVEELVCHKRQESKKLEQEYLNKIKEIDEKVHQRPLLMENKSLYPIKKK